MTDLSDKLWGGRFTEPTDAFVERFTASVDFDRRLWRQDIDNSRAHARMLCNVRVLSQKECDAILAGLETIAGEIERGEFTWTSAREDVHMHIEARLIELVGAAGKKLHTGRSRNDQVATDLRLWLRAAIDALDGDLRRLCEALLERAQVYAEVVMPGFTHLQTAQPVTFGHHLLAWFEMLLRDRERLADCRRRVDVMPLGAAALAGTTFPIDRENTARQLGFAHIAENSLDAVSDRDFAIEFAAWAALTMTHLSRFSEELVLWNSEPFGFIELPDRFCTGSSIMPQKKNPDVPELIRGKTGRVVGHLNALLMLMKSQPLAYNKDNQEDKEPLFDLVDTLSDCLRAYGDMIPVLQARPEAMRAAAQRGFATATDLADYLVRQGLPFREAHAVVGEVVAYALDAGCDLTAVPLATLQGFSELIKADIFTILSAESSVAARDHLGGTAPVQVHAAVERGRARLAGRHGGGHNDLS